MLPTLQASDVPTVALDMSLSHRWCMSFVSRSWFEEPACAASAVAEDGDSAAFDYFTEFAVTMPLLSLAAVATDDATQVSTIPPGR